MSRAQSKCVLQLLDIVYCWQSVTRTVVTWTHILAYSKQVPNVRTVLHDLAITMIAFAISFVHCLHR